MALPLILAAVGIGTTVIGGMSDYNQAKGNAELSKASGLAKRDAMERKIDALMRGQRESIGTARAVMAKRSGAGQDQTVMLEGMIMNRMARDMAELDYQKDIAGIEGIYEGEYFESAATGSAISTAGRVAGQAYTGYMAFRDAA